MNTYRAADDSGPSADGGAVPAVNLWTQAFHDLAAFVDHPSDVYFGFRLRARGPAPSLECLRAHVAGQLAALPLLTAKSERVGDRVVWIRDAAFDLRNHVCQADPERSGASLARTLVADEALAARPPWGLWLVARPDDDAWELVYLAHHGAQDATTMLGVLDRLFGTSAPRVAADETPVVASAPAGEHERRWAYGQVPEANVRAIAHAAGATINQVHLAAMSMALRTLDRELPSSATSLPPHGPLRVCLPLDTRVAKGNDDGAGNHLGLMPVTLDWRAHDPATQLASAKRSASRRSVQTWKLLWRSLESGHALPLGQRLQLRVAQRSHVTVSMTRAPGALSFGGAAFDAVIPLPWLPPGQACFTLATRDANVLTMSVLTRAGAFEPSRLATAWQGAMRALHESVVAGQEARAWLDAALAPASR